MIALEMMMRDILTQCAMQHPLPDRNHFRQAFFAEASNLVTDPAKSRCACVLILIETVRQSTLITSVDIPLTAAPGS
jgi:hypothetical protein